MHKPKILFAGAGLEGLHILVAEDSVANRMFMAEMLRQEGCRVTTADDGDIAVMAACAHSDIDIILMDGHMPCMDGFEATQIIRKEQRASKTKHTPIIALTALTMSGDRQRCIDAGMDDYLTKPVRKIDLIATLSKWTSPIRNFDGKRVASARTSRHDYVDAQASADLRSMLGAQYDEFMRIYIEDTRKRLQQIGASLDSKSGERKMVVLNAHSIHAASASAGARHLSMMASALELKARKPEAGAADLRACYDAVRTSFVMTQRAIASGL